MIKPGDKVSYLSGPLKKEIYTVKFVYYDSDSFIDQRGTVRTLSWVKLVGPAPEYEEGWTLNEGKVEIPPDAKTLKDDTGDVVAFKKIKKPVVKEYVRFAGKNLAADTYETTRYISSNYQYKIIFVETDGVLTDVRLG